MIGAAIAWLPVMASSESAQLFNYIQSILSYLAPPISATIIMAIFVPRVNEPGVFWALLIGFTIGVTRMITSFIWTDPGCDKGYGNFRFHFLYFTPLLFTISAIICLIISYCTPAIPEPKLRRLTWWTRFDDEITSYDELNEDNDEHAKVKKALTSI